MVGRKGGERKKFILPRRRGGNVDDDREMGRWMERLGEEQVVGWE